MNEQKKNVKKKKKRMMRSGRNEEGEMSTISE